MRGVHQTLKQPTRPSMLGVAMLLVAILLSGSGGHSLFFRPSWTNWIGMAQVVLLVAGAILLIRSIWTVPKRRRLNVPNHPLSLGD